MPVYKTEAIVLRQQALGEADRIVTLFTREYGKLRAAAKGIRRPASRLGGRLEPFTHARLLLARGRTLDVIAQAEIVEAFAGVRADLIRSAYAAYVAELVDRGLADRDPHQEVFALTLAGGAFPASGAPRRRGPSAPQEEAPSARRAGGGMRRRSPCPPGCWRRSTTSSGRPAPSRPGFG